MPKDMLGNDLKVGDMISMNEILRNINQPIVGRISAISEGGLAVAVVGAPKGAIQAGTLKVIIESNLNFNPTQPLNVLKAAKPLIVGVEEPEVKLENN